MRSIVICTIIGFLGAAYYGQSDSALNFLASGVASGVYLYALFGWLPARIAEQARERAQMDTDYRNRWEYLDDY